MYYSPISVFPDLEPRSMNLPTIAIVHMSFANLSIHRVNSLRAFFLVHIMYVKRINYANDAINGAIYGAIFREDLVRLERFKIAPIAGFTEYEWTPRFMYSNPINSYYRGYNVLVERDDSYVTFTLGDHFGNLSTYHYMDLSNWFRNFMEYFWNPIVVRETKCNVALAA